MGTPFKWRKGLGDCETMEACPLYLVARPKSYTVAARWTPFHTGAQYTHEASAPNIKTAKRLALEHAREMVRKLGDEIATALDEVT